MQASRQRDSRPRGPSDSSPERQPGAACLRAFALSACKQPSNESTGSRCGQDFLSSPSLLDSAVTRSGKQLPNRRAAIHDARGPAG